MLPTRRLSAGVVAMSLTAAACGGGGGGGGDDETRDVLVAGLAASVETGKELNLAEVVDGDWDRVLFVCPYEDQGTVDDRLGFVWEDFPGRDDSERSATFVFASSNAVTNWATVGRNLGDPCSGSMSTDVVPRAEARFVVQQTDETTDGKAFYSLVLKRR